PEGCEAFEKRSTIWRQRPRIDEANVIIEEIAAKGFTLTLRQLFYQFVARGLMKNTQNEYKNLGCYVTMGRNLGLIRWDRLEDRTRYLRANPTFSSAEDAIKAAAEFYAADFWRNQAWRPEVWIEKDALVGVIERVCNRYRVPFTS